MLRDLHVSNLAVLEEAAIEFGPGLNVLSGETGAGKSIVVDSLALLAGVRASSELVRTGAETLTVTGFFEPRDGAWRRVLAEAGIDAGDELVIRRLVTAAGRSRAFVNDRPVTLKLLADLAPSLLRIHGQREELGLVSPELQRTWLDRCGGQEARGLLARTADAYAAWSRVAERLERLSGDDRARRERIDFLRFQISEIDGTELVAGEEEELRQEREVLRHSEAIVGALAGACELLFERDDACLDQLTQALRRLEEIDAWEPGARGWCEELEELRIRLGELEAPLRRRAGEVEADPGRLNAVEDRLATLERLFRKYAPGSAEVLARRDEMAAELKDLEGDEGTLTELEAEAETALAAYREAAGELSAARRRWSEKLVKGVRRHLRELALAKARFAVRIDTRRRGGSPLVVGGEAVELSELGYDWITFVFSPNPGEELRPLAKVASGGELSRLYLAVQLASDPGDRTPGGRGAADPSAGATLIFDEVDSGIGGAEAAGLGAKLKRLARGGQVLAVTHLPQVASHADLHFKVTKAVRKGRTHTSVEPLTEEGRVEEVARMMAGAEVTELSLDHARELIVGANG